MEPARPQDRTPCAVSWDASRVEWDWEPETGTVLEGWAWTGSWGFTLRTKDHIGRARKQEVRAASFMTLVFSLMVLSDPAHIITFFPVVLPEANPASDLHTLQLMEVKVSLLPGQTPVHPSKSLGLPSVLWPVSDPGGLGVSGHACLLGGPACLSGVISQSTKATRRRLAWEGRRVGVVEVLAQVR